ncbi:MAG TPA: amidohydrolase [Candidatus Saccharimonadales bacterium]|jgi:predicted amidohydrolase YtcJ|nr:amidohydrolase [Candidatus Saccharimonadales bacterium]
MTLFPLTGKRDLPSGNMQIILAKLFRSAFLTMVFLAAALPACSQNADTILVNGKVLTVDPQFSTREAIAIRGGKITQVGSNADVRKQAGSQTRVIDLQGRTVIPGLIDSHIHAIRAGQTFTTEVNWVGANSIGEAMDRIHAAAAAKRPGSWLIVAGGWNVDQFKEKRRPTQADIVAAAPNDPVYVQLDYDWEVMTPAGFDAMGIHSDADLPRPGKLERDASGKPTGAILNGGGFAVAIALFDKLPHPTFDEQVEGTKKFFRELNRLGVTGVVDPGGNNLNPENYQVIFKVWRQHQMTIRVAYALCGPTSGKEFEELQSLTQMLPQGFGDEWLKFNGLGERITWGMNNNDHSTAEEQEKYYQILRWAAQKRMAVTMHWPNDETAGTLLSIYERVNAEFPIADLRWSIAHLTNASAENLKRMKAMNVGWTIQRPNAASVENAKELGVSMGAGTDAHRVASYNPFTALRWLLVDSKNGGAKRGPEQMPTREDALRAYTIGSAWFSFDEGKRGSLEPGKMADLAVLSKDYMTVPLDQLESIESLLTMVGGKIVYSAEPYAKFSNDN